MKNRRYIMTDLTNRSEILFLYDIENANPNGDPNDENKPRLDEETGKNIVTDVRLKRTIRDYLKDEKKKTLFVEEKVFDDGTIQDGKTRAKDFGSNKTEILNAVLDQCIDVRLFGATIPLEKDSITFTGPVQFKMGKSLHAVKIQHIKGTGAFASQPGAKQKTFREEYILPYSLISFCGVINENGAKHTNLKKEDVALLKDALWNGTKGLISRSKFGQMPRLLLVINYNQPNFFIGDLDNLLVLNAGNLRDEELRKPEDYQIKLDALLEKIELHSDKIENIEFITDSRMDYIKNGEKIELNILKKFTEISL